jgi:hypothetical protein
MELTLTPPILARQANVIGHRFFSVPRVRLLIRQQFCGMCGPKFCSTHHSRTIEEGIAQLAGELEEAEGRAAANVGGKAMERRNNSWPVFQRAELERFCERCATVARVSRVCATLFCAVIGATTCVNIRAPSDAGTRRMPPVRVTGAGEDGTAGRPGMRPMLGSDSAYFREHPLMVPVEGVEPQR